jgi:hypothetical protein
LIKIDLNLLVGKTNIRTKIVCFDGWNRKGLINHISKMMGMKSGLFDIYVDTENDPYRSIFYYNEFRSIKAVNREGDSINRMSKCILVKNHRKMKLWQFRLRNLCGYSCITVDENLEIGQIVRIIKQTEKQGIYHGVAKH